MATLSAFVFAQEEGGGSLIDVVPGLMVWTFLTFLIVLYVLRRVAFGRIQGVIDERRERIRQALDEADKAREEARQLRELTRQEREEAKAERDKVLEETRKQAQEQLRRGREEAEADLQRRLEENQKALEAENRKFREQIRRDVVELTLLASEKVTRKTLDDADQRRLIDETVKEIDVARIASDGDRHLALAHRIYAEALLQAAKEGKSVDRVRDEFAEFVAAAGESAELRNLLRNPQIETRGKKDALGAILEGADETFRNFVLLTADKNRVGELDDIHEEWERLLAEEERILEVELTTAIELSDEDAAGRRVEARRSVDPDLIGGLVLQAGSVRLDASVRGRLNELRTELLTAG